jgi:hypothetical protein
LVEMIVFDDVLGEPALLAELEWPSSTIAE